MADKVTFSSERMLGFDLKQIYDFARKFHAVYSRLTVGGKNPDNNLVINAMVEKSADDPARDTEVRQNQGIFRALSACGATKGALESTGGLVSMKEITDAILAFKEKNDNEKAEAEKKYKEKKKERDKLLKDKAKAKKKKRRGRIKGIISLAMIPAAIALVTVLAPIAIPGMLAAMGAMSFGAFVGVAALTLVSAKMLWTGLIKKQWEKFNSAAKKQFNQGSADLKEAEEALKKLNPEYEKEKSAFEALSGVSEELHDLVRQFNASESQKGAMKQKLVETQEFAAGSAQWQVANEFDGINEEWFDAEKIAAGGPNFDVQFEKFWERQYKGVYEEDATGAPIMTPTVVAAVKDEMKGKIVEHYTNVTTAKMVGELEDSEAALKEYMDRYVTSGTYKEVKRKIGDVDSFRVSTDYYTAERALFQEQYEEYYAKFKLLEKIKTARSIEELPAVTSGELVAACADMHGATETGSDKKILSKAEIKTIVEATAKVELFANAETRQAFIDKFLRELKTKSKREALTGDKAFAGEESVEEATLEYIADKTKSLTSAHIMEGRADNMLVFMSASKELAASDIFAFLAALKRDAGIIEKFRREGKAGGALTGKIFTKGDWNGFLKGKIERPQRTACDPTLVTAMDTAVVSKAIALLATLDPKAFPEGTGRYEKALVVLADAVLAGKIDAKTEKAIDELKDSKYRGEDAIDSPTEEALKAWEGDWRVKKLNSENYSTKALASCKEQLAQINALLRIKLADADEAHMDTAVSIALGDIKERIAAGTETSSLLAEVRGLYASYANKETIEKALNNTLELVSKGGVASSVINDEKAAILSDLKKKVIKNNETAIKDAIRKTCKAHDIIFKDLNDIEERGS